MILILLLFPLAFVGSVVSQNICDLQIQMGTNCTKASPASNSSIRFFYDVTLKRCLPFRYTGCGGNENNFADFKQCRQRCVPQDLLFCPGNYPPEPNNAGGTHCNSETPCANLKNNFCHTGPNGAGLCCSLRAKKLVEQDREPTCPNGKKKYSVFKGGKDRVVIGKLCAHEFCPTDYECKAGNIYAYCCAK